MYTTANCTIIAQFPIGNHSDQGQFAEMPLKIMGKVQNLVNYHYAIRSNACTASFHRSKLAEDL
jgi:hypothetical protein